MAHTGRVHGTKVINAVGNCGDPSVRREIESGEMTAPHPLTRKSRDERLLHSDDRIAMAYHTQVAGPAIEEGEQHASAALLRLRFGFVGGELHERRGLCIDMRVIGLELRGREELRGGTAVGFV
jgi:hypothetical protein